MSSLKAGVSCFRGQMVAVPFHRARAAAPISPPLQFNAQFCFLACVIYFSLFLVILSVFIPTISGANCRVLSTTIMMPHSRSTRCLPYGTRLTTERPLGGTRDPPRGNRRPTDISGPPSLKPIQTPPDRVFGAIWIHSTPWSSGKEWPFLSGNLQIIM